MTQQECEEAAQQLGLSDTSAQEDDDGNAAYNDPPYCYFESNKLYFDRTARNTGGCSSSDQCICKNIGLDSKKPGMSTTYVQPFINFFKIAPCISRVLLNILPTHVCKQLSFSGPRLTKGFSGPALASAIQQGTRLVRREPDWKWDNQDGAPGSVGEALGAVGVGTGSPGWVRVRWLGNGKANNYR